MTCKILDGKKLCLINGKWVEMEKNKKIRLSNSKSIKFSRNGAKRTGAC